MFQLRPDHLLILQILAPNLSNNCTCLTKSLESSMLLNIIKMATRSVALLPVSSVSYTTITLHLNTFSSTIVRLFAMYSILIWSPTRNMSFTSTKHLTRPNTFATTLYFCSESNMERSFPPTQPSTLLAI